MKLTDTHCHLDYHKFDADRTEVIQRALAVGLIRILIPGLDHQSSAAAVRLAEANPAIYAAVGFHPTDLVHFSDETFRHIQDLSCHPKVVAIGEIGLDYYWVTDPHARAVQRKVLENQLRFAQEVEKPVVIHMREENDVWYGEASRDLLEILANWQRGLQGTLRQNPGVLHSFNGNLKTAEEALNLNFFIGITGPVTYKNAGQKRELIGQLPLEQLLIETDAPFLAPEPFRGKRNEPAYIVHIADKIALIHSKSPAEIAELTTANAARLFAWGD